jgi:hypothetical protein
LGDVAGCDQFGPAATQGLNEVSRPSVLEDQDGGQRTGRDRGCCFGEVGLADQAGRDALEDGQVHRAVEIEVLELEESQRAVLTLPHEDQV